MKRGAIEHPKMRLLAKELKIPVCQAVGILECLWHFTARSARRGNVGKSTNAEIAEACYWEDDPDALIQSLIKRRWLDEHKEHRLIVHDWHDHADDAVKKALERNKETFLSINGNVEKCPDISRLPVPVPVPVPKNKSVGHARKARTPPLADDEFIAHLKSSPAYAGIDVDVELAKMDAWLLTPRGRGKKKTRARILNWLNKCDKPMGATPQKTDPPKCRTCGRPATAQIGREHYCSQHFMGDRAHPDGR